jgi:putative transposase
VDKNGDIMGSGPIPCAGRPGEKAVSLNELHKAANNIIEIANKNKSQVIVQNLVKMGDEIRWSDNNGNGCRPVYDRRTYIRLAELLDYKLADAGLPSPVGVSSADIFCRCFDCGLYSKKNRFSRDMFICTKCGATMGIEELGSLNLARKLIRYGRSRIRVKAAAVPGGTRFTSKLIGLDCFISHDENQPDVLKYEIQRLIDDMRQNRAVGELSSVKEYRRRSSLLKKFGRSANCMDLIEFI